MPAKQSKSRSVSKTLVVHNGGKSNAPSMMITVRVTLRGITPPIWRELRLSGTMTLSELHYAIQGAFGWEESHLHAFQLSRDESYTVHFDALEDPRTKDASTIMLSKLIERNIKAFTYEYDFGDSWEHDVKMEKVELTDKPPKQPQCTAGARSCPPEDCGGTLGYENFVAAIADHKHPDHQDLKVWYGRKYDPEKFSVKSANTRIKKFLAELED